MELPIRVGEGLASISRERLHLNRSHTAMPPASATARAVPSWSEAITRLGGEGSRLDTQSGVRAENLRDLLQLQYDLSRYHLRVELLSKVAESAVASLRKLQQNQ